MQKKTTSGLGNGNMLSDVNEMPKMIYRGIEKLLRVVLLSLASVGAFLLGCFGANLMGYDLTSREMTLIALGGMALVYILYCAMMRVRYAWMEIEALEMEVKKDPQAKALCEHLGVL